MKEAYVKKSYRKNQVVFLWALFKNAVHFSPVHWIQPLYISLLGISFDH